MPNELRIPLLGFILTKSQKDFIVELYIIEKDGKNLKITGYLDFSGFFFVLFCFFFMKKLSSTMKVG